MGMGEPLLNLEELGKALVFFTEPEGLNISKRRITVSTSGIEKGILDLRGAFPGIRLALSLTTASRDLRERLMPITRQNPLPRIKEALLLYQKEKKLRITLEIVLIGGVNTDLSGARETAEFASGLDTVINLIPWNPVDGLEFEGRPLQAPTIRETADFCAALESHGLKVTRRIGKGLGISGACGQLGAA
jgi:23S rRNA (adenine2503-C2)-methyltransferase